MGLDNNPQGGDGRRSFLPDFCDIRVVFAVVLVAQMSAFVVTLVRIEVTNIDLWSDLSKVSLFIQWIALSSLAMLCMLRKWLLALPDLAAALVAYGVLLLVAIGINELAIAAAHPAAPLSALQARENQLFVVQNVTISAILNGLLLRYLFVQYQWKKHVQAQAQARVEALQARIRPHFLFNSMNTIASLTATKPLVAEQVVEDLSELFRATLTEHTNLSSLETEIELANRYLAIEKLRLGERLAWQWQLAEVPLQVKLPALTLQPLLENAVYHGIEPLPGGGTIRIQVQLHDQQLHIQITNPVYNNLRAEVRQGNRMALENIRERLALAYQGKAVFVCEALTDEFKVSLSIPYCEETS